MKTGATISTSVTRDRIIDRDKKPFGKESFRSAPIKNIQSVGHQIPNTIGLILNVGNVRINVGMRPLPSMASTIPPWFTRISPGAWKNWR